MNFEENTDVIFNFFSSHESGTSHTFCKVSPDPRDLEGPSQRAITRYSYHTEIQTHVFIIKI